jgi:CDP-diglyceride synthetase
VFVPSQPEPTISEYEKKKQTFVTRSIWTFVMIGAFFGAMFMGHIYIIGIVTAVQIVSFKEVIAIANVPSRARQLRFTKALNWYWLATTMYFLYGESVIYYFKHIVLVDKVLLPFATHHRFISFMLYVIGKSSALPCQVWTGTHAGQDSSSSLHLYRPGTTDSNSPSSHGRTWPCISSSSRHTLL